MINSTRPITRELNPVLSLHQARQYLSGKGIEVSQMRIPHTYYDGEPLAESGYQVYFQDLNERPMTGNSQLITLITGTIIIKKESDGEIEEYSFAYDYKNGPTLTKISNSLDEN